MPAFPAFGRWLATVKMVTCKMSDDTPAHCMFRRLQLNEQQAERSRKNCLQKALVFDCHAKELMKEDNVE